MKLTGAAILVSRGMKVLQATPAAYPYRSCPHTPVMFSWLVLISGDAFESDIGCLIGVAGIMVRELTMMPVLVMNF